MKKQQIQKQEQITAYDKKVTHDLFLITMEWLEKYIEIVYKNEFPDWEQRKQIHDNNIKRTDIYSHPERAENTLSTQLLLFESTSGDKAPFIREEIKQEFYQWINAVGIDANNCPEKLKHYLFGINEILEGRGEKIRRDVENKKRIVDPHSPEYMEQMKNLFVHNQVASREEIKTEKSLEGKTHLDMEIESKFGGNVEQGEEAFNLIAGVVSTSHGSDFHFFPQKEQRTNSEIIQDIRQNPRNWRIDEIIIDLGENRQERVLIHQSARLEDYDQRTGKLNFVGNAIYQASRFNAEEQAQINQALNISQQSAQVQQQKPYKWTFE
jgi:hypothetical protein